MTTGQQDYNLCCHIDKIVLSAIEMSNDFHCLQSDSGLFH
jgi:hypothetical protein